MPHRAIASLPIPLTLVAPQARTEAAELAAHHRADGFQNNYAEFEPKGLGDLLK